MQQAATIMPRKTSGPSSIGTICRGAGGWRGLGSNVMTRLSVQQGEGARRGRAHETSTCRLAACRSQHTTARAARASS
jgi:hypothetical protein